MLLVYASYWVVMEPPQAHAFYVLAPIAFMFTAFWWTLVDSPRARQIAAGVLALSVAFHAGLAWAQAPEVSLYRNREVVATAVRLKPPEMFAHRRDFAVDGGPIAPQRSVAPLRSDARLPGADVGVSRRDRGDRCTGRSPCTTAARWSPSAIRCTSPPTSTIAMRVVEERHERLKDIFQPGETRTIELNDGFAGPPFTKARMQDRGGRGAPAGSGRLRTRGSDSGTELGTVSLGRLESTPSNG